MKSLSNEASLKDTKLLEALCTAFEQCRTQNELNEIIKIANHEPRPLFCDLKVFLQRQALREVNEFRAIVEKQKSSMSTLSSWISSAFYSANPDFQKLMGEADTLKSCLQNPEFARWLDIGNELNVIKKTDPTLWYIYDKYHRLGLIPDTDEKAKVIKSSTSSLPSIANDAIPQNEISLKQAIIEINQYEVKIKDICGERNSKLFLAANTLRQIMEYTTLAKYIDIEKKIKDVCSADKTLLDIYYKYRCLLPPLDQHVIEKAADNDKKSVPKRTGSIVS